MADFILIGDLTGGEYNAGNWRDWVTMGRLYEFVNCGDFGMETQIFQASLWYFWALTQQRAGKTLQTPQETQVYWFSDAMMTGACFEEFLSQGYDENEAALHARVLGRNVGVFMPRVHRLCMQAFPDEMRGEMDESERFYQYLMNLSRSAAKAVLPAAVEVGFEEAAAALSMRPQGMEQIVKRRLTQDPLAMIDYAVSRGAVEADLMEKVVALMPEETRDEWRYTAYLLKRDPGNFLGEMGVDPERWPRWKKIIGAVERRGGGVKSVAEKVWGLIAEEQGMDKDEVREEARWLLAEMTGGVVGFMRNQLISQGTSWWSQVAEVGLDELPDFLNQLMGGIQFDLRGRTALIRIGDAIRGVRTVGAIGRLRDRYLQEIWADMYMNAVGFWGYMTHGNMQGYPEKKQLERYRSQPWFLSSLSVGDITAPYVLAATRYFGGMEGLLSTWLETQQWREEGALGISPRQEQMVQLLVWAKFAGELVQKFMGGGQDREVLEPIVGEIKEQDAVWEIVGRSDIGEAELYLMAAERVGGASLAGLRDQIFQGGGVWFREMEEAASMHPVARVVQGCMDELADMPAVELARLTRRLVREIRWRMDGKLPA